MPMMPFSIKGPVLSPELQFPGKELFNFCSRGRLHPCALSSITSIIHHSHIVYLYMPFTHPIITKTLYLQFITMKSVCFACCFLILAFHISPSPTADARLQRRQLASFQPFEPVVGKEKTEIVDKTNGSTTQHIGGDEGLVYFVDYHGVETHPSPRTKHPKP